MTCCDAQPDQISLANDDLCRFYGLKMARRTQCSIVLTTWACSLLCQVPAGRPSQSMHCGTKVAQCHHCETQPSATLIAPGIEHQTCLYLSCVLRVFVTAQCLKCRQDQQVVRCRQMLSAVRPVVTCRTFVPTDVHRLHSLHRCSTESSTECSIYALRILRLSSAQLLSQVTKKKGLHN